MNDGTIKTYTTLSQKQFGFLNLQMKRLKHWSISDEPVCILFVAVLVLLSKFLTSVCGSLYGTILLLGL